MLELYADSLISTLLQQTSLTSLSCSRNLRSFQSYAELLILNTVLLLHHFEACWPTLYSETAAFKMVKSILPVSKFPCLYPCLAQQLFNNSASLQLGFFLEPLLCFPCHLELWLKLINTQALEIPH